ncbi:SRPBCC family protein [Kribbella sp.]|uniref:SRPBCC family protein n=1 Tax=Kribbella sp. TaxID=1871183 RepID=UPI002D7220EF|nr:SRPBCC family protein [Kribbella sp.]HZX01516.1 SRPBCC family protein [Kribbella sp.]
MSKPAMIHVTYIETTPEKLWEALTSGAFTKLYWFGRRIESEWSVGSPVRFYDSADDSLTDSGEVLVYDEPKMLAYTFKNEVSDGEQVPGRVTFTIEPRNDTVVKLQVVHDQIAEDTVEGWRNGWGPILANLKTYLETGRTLQF